jgi:hypothetical protein
MAVAASVIAALWKGRLEVVFMRRFTDIVE